MIAEQIVNGIVLGSMYALVALGYTLVFGVLDKLNFALSELFMLGGFIVIGSVSLGAPIWVAGLAVLVICGLLGLVIEFVSFRKFTSADAQVTAALSSLAVGLIIIDLVQKTWGGEPVSVPVPVAWRSASVALFGMQVQIAKLSILAITLVLMVVLHILISRTAMGRNIRAVAESPTSATLLGIDVKRVNQQTFFIASALAGAGGLMFSLRTGIASSEVGFTFGLKALAIMAIGGMGDLRGAVLGGILVGIIESLAIQFGFGKLGEIIVWALMILVLLARPGGLFGGSHTSEQRA